MNDEQLLRYSRQIMLPQVDVAGQERLLDSHMLVVGAGGLGSPVAMYLAAAGIGHLTIADHDQVDLSNLQRQLLHRNSDIGRNKTDSARDTLTAINPEITVTGLPVRITGDVLERETAGADVVLDCSDNFTTRFEINRACVRRRTPLVSGAAVRFEGQLAVFDSRREDSPCYNCLYQQANEEMQNCADNGVLSPLTGVIGALQAVEAIKLVLGTGRELCGRLVMFDALAHEWRTLSLARDPACPTCGSR